MITGGSIIMRLDWRDMPKITTRVTFNHAAAVARIQAANDRALTAMGNQALQDTSKHVPKDQGTLKDSGLAPQSDMHAEDGRFVMRWSTPYAKYLWNGDVMHGNPTERTYGPEKIKFTDALAREEWAKYAKEVYGKEWKKVYQAALRRELK